METKLIFSLPTFPRDRVNSGGVDRRGMGGGGVNSLALEKPTYQILASCYAWKPSKSSWWWWLRVVESKFSVQLGPKLNKIVGRFFTLENYSLKSAMYYKMF